jgi:hypothetical protein
LHQKSIPSSALPRKSYKRRPLELLFTEPVQVITDWREKTKSEDRPFGGMLFAFS